MRRISIFVIALVLIAGVVGCGSGVQYGLTITSTAGGSVTEPGEGTFTYDEGTIVDLVAEPDEGYVFVDWTGDVETIANVDTPTSTITMSGDYSVTANFVLATPAMDWYDLDAIRNNLAGAYVLMNDLDSTTPGYEELAGAAANGGKGWEPIGTSDSQFTGVLDGQGHEIRDLFVSRSDESYVGLFGYVAEGATIRDIGVANVAVTGYDYVGSLVGRNDGTVVDSYSIGSVNGQEYVGGLVGYDLGHTVSNSYYNYDESLINGDNLITIGALYDEAFEQWMANNKSLDVNEWLSQEDGYYLINDVNDFKCLLVFGQNATLKLRLTNDLDLGDEPNFYIPYFAGEFDGNGHRISNLRLNLSGFAMVGLFGYLVLGGNITALDLENVNVIGNSFVGGLAGCSRGNVSDSYCTGNVSGEAGVAGLLVGQNWGGTVTNSYSTGSVGIVGEATYVGGLVGENREGTVANSYSISSVNGEGFIGGLVGVNNGTITGSYSTGSMNGRYYRVGGLVGLNEDHGIVSNSYSIATVTGEGHLGGLVGFNYGTVISSHSSGSVTGDWMVAGLVGHNWGGIVTNSYSSSTVSGNVEVGGLVGENREGTVGNSYSSGNVTGEDFSAGGLVGRNQGGNVTDSYSTGSVGGNQLVGGLVGDNLVEGNVSNSYSTGSVSGNVAVGGLVGVSYGTVANCYWDTETSGQSSPWGGTGKTTAEMQDISTFSGAGWHITAVANSSTRNPAYIWNIVDDETYPFLGWGP